MVPVETWRQMTSIWPTAIVDSCGSVRASVPVVMFTFTLEVPLVREVVAAVVTVVVMPLPLVISPAGFDANITPLLNVAVPFTVMPFCTRTPFSMVGIAHPTQTTLNELVVGAVANMTMVLLASLYSTSQMT